MKTLLHYFKKISIRDYLLFSSIIALTLWNFYQYERIDELEYEISWLDNRIDENHDLVDDAKKDVKDVFDELNNHRVFESHSEHY